MVEKLLEKFGEKFFGRLNFLQTKKLSEIDG